jgi:pimeloyl-ACP methyl ester carboxylesterase
MIKLQQIAFAPPDDLHCYDHEPIVVHARPEQVSRNLVLLVHGLTGHRYGYWNDIPRFILEDLPQADVGLYFYKTALRRFSWFKSIDLEQEARVLADSLRSIRLYDAVVLVGHSMGGLLAKAAIADLINRNHPLTLQHIAGLVLIASPQLGSMRVPGALRLFSKDGRALYPHNEMIRRIDTTLNARLSIAKSADPLDKYSIPTWAIIAAEDFWVDSLSAGIGIPETQKMTFRGLHGSIIHPPTKEAPAYQFTRDCLETSFQPKRGGGEEEEEILVADASPDDVSNIRAMAVEFFGADVSPEGVLVGFAAAKGILKVVKRAINAGLERRERFSGYFCVIPLSGESAQAMKAGTLRGYELNTSHLPTGTATTAALYIGAIAARDHYSRAVVLEALRLHIIYSLALGAKEVLTKPLTREGLRLVRKYGFQPLQGDGGLSEMYIIRA